jgi:hypothetical protein
VLVDGRGLEIEIPSQQKLVSSLGRLDDRFRAEREPRIATLSVDLEAEDAPYLSLGLGADECVVCFDDPRAGGGWYARGRRRSTAEIHFAYGTDESYYPTWALIPRELAFAAANEFFVTRQRPTNVNWRDWAWRPPARRHRGTR